MEIEALIRGLPKIEQHVHIVGSMRPETLLWLPKEGGLKKPFGTAEDVVGSFDIVTSITSSPSIRRFLGVSRERTNSNISCMRC